MQNYVRSLQFWENLHQIKAEFVNKLTVFGLSLSIQHGPSVINKSIECQNMVIFRA